MLLLWLVDKLSPVGLEEQFVISFSSLTVAAHPMPMDKLAAKLVFIVNEAIPIVTMLVPIL